MHPRRTVRARLRARVIAPTLRAAAALAALTILGACHHDDPASPPVAAAVVAATGTTPQSAVVNSTVSVAPAVIVTTRDGRPVPGVPVTFAVASGGGSLAGSSATTDATGRATAGTWTLGTAAGSNTVTASVTSPTGLPTVTFSATGIAGPVTTFTVTPTIVGLNVAGTQQVTVSAAADQYGNAVTAPTVSFTTQSAGVATVTPAGLVTAVASGSTTVTATIGTISRTVTVNVFGHPSGATVTQVAEQNRPFGIGVSVNGIGYTTELDASRVARYSVATTSISSTTIGVGSTPTDVAFSPDGSRAYVTSLDQPRIYVVDVASGVATSTIALPGRSARLLLTPDGGTLYAGIAGGGLLAINLATSGVTAVSLPGASFVTNGIALNPARGVLYASDASGSVYEISRATNAVLRQFNVAGRAQDVAVSADGSRLFVANEDGVLEVHDAVTLATVTTLPAASGAFGLALTRDGRQLYVTRPNNGNVLVLDAATYAVVQTLGGSTARRVAFDAAGLTALITNEGGFVTFVR